MKKTQFGWIFFIVVIAINSIIFYQEQGIKERSLVSALSFIILMLFYKLTIKVTDKHLKFTLGIGLINGKYQLEDIISCKPLSYIPFGYGIRIKPGAILFNVSGKKQLSLR